MDISSYGSVYALGHRETKPMLEHPVWVEEKIDGSQGSLFCDDSGALHFRSKGKMLVGEAPEKMFAPWVHEMQALHRASEFLPGYTYRGEVLTRPKHNILAYSRTPDHFFMVFDIDAGDQDYMDTQGRRDECARLGLESVPVFHEGRVESMAELARLLDRESVLGGPKIEGVVLKSPGLYDAMKKRLMAKYVSEAFKEKHGSAWKAANPGKKDVVLRLIETYRTEGRWRKAVQHLRDDGKLTDSPRDIGLLFQEVPDDVQRECAEEIKEILFAHYWPHVRRGLCDGLPQWYKDQLAESAMPVCVPEDGTEEAE